MQTDQIKLWFTYVLATVVIVGGGVMLFVSRNESNSDFQLLVAGFIGGAIGFVFNAESSTRAVRSYERGLNTTVVAEE